MIIVNNPEKAQNAIILGNGLTEYKIIEALVDKFEINGVKVFIIHGAYRRKNLIVKSTIGGVNAIKTLQMLIKLTKRGIFNFKKIGIIIDNEHVDELRKTLKTILNLDLKARKYAEFVIDNFMVFISICGKKKCIEENISDLIMELFPNALVPPTKREIRNFLRTKKLKLKKIINLADRQVLIAHLGCIVKILKRLS